MEERVVFYSDGLQLSGILEVPDVSHQQRFSAIVLPPGNRMVEKFLLPDFSRKFTAAGYATLRFDYRGFGESQGPRCRPIPLEQVEDIRNAVTFVRERQEVDPSRIGVFSFMIGAAHAIYAAGVDSRIRAVAALLPFGSGERWLRSLRRLWEWSEFLARLEQDRINRVLTGKSMVVHRDEIIVPDPHSAESFKSIVEKHPELDHYFPLEIVDKIIEYRPEEVIGRIEGGGVFLIHVEKSDVVSVEEARILYAKANEAKRLLILPNILHHDVYSGAPFEKVTSECVKWFDGRLRESDANSGGVSK